MIKILFPFVIGFSMVSQGKNVLIGYLRKSRFQHLLRTASRLLPECGASLPRRTKWAQAPGRPSRGRGNTTGNAIVEKDQVWFPRCLHQSTYFSLGFHAKLVFCFMQNRNVLNVSLWTFCEPSFEKSLFFLKQISQTQKEQMKQEDECCRVPAELLGSSTGSQTLGIQA